ncbi:LysM peptidoglycan-binding domain-containing protein, partial [Glaesserella parasuis]|uniref:LysM peptidoglycan-binding domain-containing protein n=1 Tax=Glaesserella parasuis TaxID=738 RepID=UPI003B671A7D
MKKGDNLYYIAYITDRDIDDIIKHNNLQPPYTIYPGQTLALWKPAYQRPDVAKSTSGATNVASATSSAAKAAAVAVSSSKSTENGKFGQEKKAKTAVSQQKAVEAQSATRYSQIKQKSKQAVNNKRTASVSNQQISWQWPTN